MAGGATQFLGLPDHEIGEIRGDKCEVKGTKFVVAMIHSLSKEGRYPDWIAKEFGLVIFDECHSFPRTSSARCRRRAGSGRLLRGALGRG